MWRAEQAPEGFRPPAKEGARADQQAGDEDHEPDGPNDAPLEQGGEVVVMSLLRIWIHRGLHPRLRRDGALAERAAVRVQLEALAEDLAALGDAGLTASDPIT